jgi:hypothetical protein
VGTAEAGEVYRSFSYDNLDRLVAAEYDIGDNNEVFTLDGLGNTESVNVRDGNTITYDVNELSNRYASVGGSGLEYDAGGRATFSTGQTEVGIY